MSYDPLVPTGTIPLRQDYLNLQQNAGALDTIFGIDHTPFSTGTAISGYHSVVHLVPASNPPATSNAGQVYCETVSDVFATDTQLFYQTAGGIKILMTRNLLPVNDDNNSYSFLPGGALIQWGFKTASSTSISSVVFPKAFKAGTKPIISISLETTRTGDTAVIQGNPAPTNTGFSLRISTGSGGTMKFLHWIAIGQ